MKSRIEELARDYGIWPEIIPHGVSEKGIATIAESVIQCQIIRFSQSIHNEALEMAAKECEKRIAGDGEPEDVEHRYCAEAIRKLKEKNNG